MKKLKQFPCIVLFFFVQWQNLTAQVLQAFKYKAATRDNTGNLISNQLVAIRTNILEFTITEKRIYIETHSVTTNLFDIIGLVIGQGALVSNYFGSIQHNSRLFNK
jgi:hypothetical protein